MMPDDEPRGVSEHGITMMYELEDLRRLKKAERLWIEAFDANPLQCVALTEMPMETECTNDLRAVFRRILEPQP